MNTTGETNISAQENDSDEQQEVIQVQILPQVGPVFFSWNAIFGRILSSKCHFKPFWITSTGVF